MRTCTCVTVYLRAWFSSALNEGKSDLHVTEIEAKALPGAKMDVADSSETLVHTYQTTRCRNPSYHSMNLRRPQSPSSHSCNFKYLKATWKYASYPDSVSQIAWRRNECWQMAECQRRTAFTLILAIIIKHAEQVFNADQTGSNCSGTAGSWKFFDSLIHASTHVNAHTLMKCGHLIKTLRAGPGSERWPRQ